MIVSQDTFPVVYSTLGKDALITRVLAQYNLSIITNLQLWHRGLSDVYLVETENCKYILRVSHNHWRNFQETVFELELLNFLHQNKIPVAHPICTKNDELCIEINAPEGKRYAALFIYAPGEIPLGDFNVTQAKKIGENLAKIHQIGGNFQSNYYRQPLNLEYLLDESLKIIIPLLKEQHLEINYLQETAFNLKNKVKKLPEKNPFWTVCWGDPHSGNTHFTIDTQLTLFDFDQCGYGWRIFDIGKFFQRAINTGMTRKTRKAFMEAYQTINHLTLQELELLRYFTQIAHIWMWAISINTAMIHDWCLLDHSYFHRRLQQLKMLTCHDCELF